MILTLLPTTAQAEEPTEINIDASANIFDDPNGAWAYSSNSKTLDLRTGNYKVTISSDLTGFTLNNGATISDGTLCGTVNNNTGGSIDGGTFNGMVYNNTGGIISGGTFYGGIIGNTVSDTAAIYSLKVTSPANYTLNFSAPSDYSSVPSQTVTVKNTGNQSLTLKAVVNNDYFSITNADAAISVGDTEDITVTPASSKSVGTYSTTLTIGADDSNVKTSYVTLSFTVFSASMTATLDGQGATTQESASVTATYNSAMPAITPPVRAHRDL